MDYTEAVRWFRLAADQGNAQAQCSLGLMHTGKKGAYSGMCSLADSGEAPTPTRTPVRLNAAFAYCSSLASITIPDSVTPSETSPQYPTQHELRD